MHVLQAPLSSRQFLREEVHDDMIPEAVLLAGVSLAATFLSTGGDPSMMAIPGAMLAAVVALLKATSEKRLWTDKGIVVIGTSIIGTTIPSAAVSMFWPSWLDKLTWHVFLLAGFLSGIIGWGFAWAAILALDARRDKLARKAIEAVERKYGLGFGTSDSESGKKVS